MVRTAWNKGIPRTEEEKNKISLAVIGKNKGIKFTEEHKRKISESLRGRIMSKESRKKMSLSRLGKPIFKARKRVTLECPVCGKIFEVKLSHKEKRKTCSSQCMAKLYKRSLIGVNNPHYKGGMKSKICEFCKKEYFIIPALYERSRWCSRECVNGYRKSTEGRKVQSDLAIKNGYGLWMRKRYGVQAPGFRGGRFKTKGGYILILKRDHPSCNKHGYIFEHRLVIEEFLGRSLNKGEIIHHLNGIKNDNRIENLSLCSGRTHHLYIKKLQDRIRELEARPIEDVQNTIK